MGFGSEEGEEGFESSDSEEGDAESAPEAPGEQGMVIDGQPSWRKRKNDNCYWMPVPGGWLAYDCDQEVLSAHCIRDDHRDRRTNPCRLRRTFRNCTGKRPKGRPIGFLMAWLEDAGRHKGAQAHCDVGKQEKAKPLDIAALCFDFRKKAREDLKASGHEV